MKDHEKLIAWLREAADELEKTHRVLYEMNVPENAPDGTPYSLAARVALLADMVP